MPRTRSLAWSELKIGVLTIAAIVIAVVTIFLLTGERGFPWQRHRLKARFSNVAGLKSGSPVRVAGVEVGTVQAVELVRDEVEVLFDVNSAYRDRITSESTARLGSVSLLGESAVDISPSTRGTPIAEMEFVPSVPAPLQFADLTEQAGTGIEEITNLIRDMRSGRGTAGRLMVDDGLYTQLERFVTTAGELTTRLGEDRGTLGRLLNDRTAANALEASLTNIETLTRRINAGEGSLGKLLQDDAFSRTLAAATANVSTLTERLNAGQGTMGKLMTDDALFTRLNEVTERFDELLARLNEGEGTAGRLLQDEQLYENMNTAVGEFRSLLGDIREDPRRYLNVRVSIF